MFKTFPEFSKLTLNERQEYETYIKDFPPIGDLSFAGLMTWWNPMGDVSISLLNDNLVIPFWLPGDDKNSGLSIVGAHKIDESLCTVFDYLRERGERPRLVNVPEFVISSVRYPEMFNFKSHRSREEYIFAASQFYPLKNMNLYRRRKVNRILHEVDSDNILVKSLDLDDSSKREFLYNSALEWQAKNINNYGRHEIGVIKTSLSHSNELGIENACLFVDGKLYGFCLYIIPNDKRYIIVQSVKATNRGALGFELMAYMLSQWFADKGVLYGNLNSDYGMMRLRMFMLTLGPVNFFRKYIIEPA